MAKTLTIQIKSAGDALDGFRDTFKAVEARRRISRREGVYFTSTEAARNLLTPNRLALLRAIRSSRPGSIYELAKMVRRDSSDAPGIKLLATRELPSPPAGNHSVRQPPTMARASSPSTRPFNVGPASRGGVANLGTTPSAPRSASS